MDYQSTETACAHLYVSQYLTTSLTASEDRLLCHYRRDLGDLDVAVATVDVV